MVIKSEFRMEQFSHDDHREDAPHFIQMFLGLLEVEGWMKTFGKIFGRDFKGGEGGKIMEI